jgi:hypothetical protein
VAVVVDDLAHSVLGKERAAAVTVVNGEIDAALAAVAAVTMLPAPAALGAKRGGHD